MRVRCRYNDREGLLASSRSTNWISKIQFHDISLTVGTEYVVAAMFVYLDVLEFLVPDQDGGPVAAPAGLFDLVDDSIPDSWVFSTTDILEEIPIDEAADISAIWGYREIVEDRRHIVALFDRQPLAIRQFHAALLP